MKISFSNNFIDLISLSIEVKFKEIDCVNIWMVSFSIAIAYKDIHALYITYYIYYIYII